MNDVLSILTIRRTALNRAFELIEADQDLSKYPSRAVIVLEREIAGLNFVIDTLGATIAATIGYQPIEIPSQRDGSSVDIFSEDLPRALLLRL